MDRVRPASFRSFENSLNVQVRFGGGGWANQISFICLEHMHGFPIYLGIDRDRADSKLMARAYHAHGNLATISDQDFCEHLRISASVEISITFRWPPEPLIVLKRRSEPCIPGYHDLLL